MLQLETKITFSSVQLLSHVRLIVTPWTAAGHASLSITNSQSLLKLLRYKRVNEIHRLMEMKHREKPRV